MRTVWDFTRRNVFAILFYLQLLPRYIFSMLVVDLVCHVLRMGLSYATRRDFRRADGL